MRNTRENAQEFLEGFGKGKSFVDRLEGVQDFVDLLTEYANKIDNKYIPNDAHSFEVFAIKDCEDSHTGKQAFIGFKLDNNDFHFIGVPYTEPILNTDNRVKELTKAGALIAAEIDRLLNVKKISMADEEILQLDFYDFCGIGSCNMSDEDKIKWFRDSEEAFKKFMEN